MNLMKTYILILISVLVFFEINAQENDTISSLNKELRVDTNSAKTMNMDELYSLMKPYPEAFKHIQFAKESHVFSTVFSTLSGFPLGYALGVFFFKSEFLWKPVAIGGGLLGLALLFDIRTNNQIRKAIDAYNDRNDNVYRENRGINLGVGFTQHGVGVVLRF